MAIRHLHDLSVVGNVTVATTGVTNNVLLTSTDTSAASAPDLVLYRNALIADSDTLGVLEFQGRNGMVTSSTAPLTYGAIYGRVFDASENHTGLGISANKGNGSGAFVDAMNITLKGTNNSAEGAVIINPSTTFELPDSNLEVKGSYGITTESHGSSANWKQAYDNHITGVAVTGTSTKTITLTQRDGGTISANFSDQSGSGGITMTNGVNDRIVTAASSTSVNGESGLLFGGSYLEITPGNIATPLQVKRTSASTRQVNLLLSANDGSSTSEGFLGIDSGADLRYGGSSNTSLNSLVLTEDNTDFVVNSSTNSSIIRLAGGGTNFTSFSIGGEGGAVTINTGSNSLTVGLNEFIEEKYIYTSNDSNGVYMPMVKGGMYATSASSVTGQILIKIPSYKTDMMQQFYVDIYEYDTGESMTFKISGYNYSDTNATWYNTSVVNLSDDTDRDFTVRFGADTSLPPFQYVAIGETNSTWSYPQVNVRDFFGGYATSEGDTQGSFDISFVTTTPGSVSRTHTNNFVAGDYNNLKNTPTIPTVNNGQLTVQGTGALGGSGTFTANQSGNTTISISHDDTSSQSSVDNSNGTVIQDVTLDGYGHVTALGSVNLDSRYYTESESDSRYVRTTGNQTISGTKTFDNGSIVISGTHGTISFMDTTSGEDNFYLHTNSNNFYVLVDRDGTDAIDGGYESPHPLQLEGDTNTAYTFGNRILTTADEGSGNGLDADTLDGIQGASFLRSNTADTATGALTFSGATFFNGNIGNSPSANPGVHIGISAGGDGQIQIIGTSAHIDFSNAGSEDYDARIILEGNDELNVAGVGNNFQVNGYRVLTTLDEGSGNGIDADTVDGIQSSRIIYGSNDSGTNEGVITDWNNVSKSGFYSDDGASNRWSTSNWSSIIHHKLYDNNNNYASQIGFDTYDAEMYYRMNNAGTWTSWQRIFMDDYHPNADKWTTARTITLGGDLSGSVSIDGSANVTLNAQVTNNSHTHDDRYYTETESDARFLRKDTDETYSRKRFNFGASTNWDAVGFGNLTNVHMQGHNQFWIGAGNGTWFAGTANTKNSASGLAADANQAHDLLISTMQSTSTTDRGITFAVDSGGSGNSGYRLGKWHSSNEQHSSKLTIDGGLNVRGGDTANYDYYADDYSTYWDNNGGQAYWGGDANWIDPSITAGNAIQIQAGNLTTNSNNPALQFHQYGYGGVQMRYDGPSDVMHLESTGSNRYDYFQNTTDHGYIQIGPMNTSHAHIYTDRPNFYFNKELRVNNQQVFHTGYHPNADTLTTARTIAGSSFNGSANIDISYNNLTNKPTIPSGSSLVRVYTNQNYVASSSSTSNRGNFGAGLTVYEGYSSGTNRPFTYDTTLQIMSTTSQGFEISADWVSSSSTPLKVRSLRDCCQGWSPWINIWTEYNFTQTNINNWNTAYGWGNHASAGYLTGSPTSITIGGILLEDSSDRSGLLEINQKGSSSWSGIQIVDGSNRWSFMGNNSDVGIYDDTNGEWALLYNINGATELYYNGSRKLQTKSNGIDVTGGITSTGSWSYTNGSYGTQTIGYYYGAAYWYNTSLSYYIGSLTGTSSSVNRFHVKGSIGVGSASASTTWGKIDASNDIVAYSSDKRLKENILPINGALDKISKLSGFTYNWNEKAKEKAAFNTEERLVGVFAQDVQEVLPEAVKLAPFDNDGSDVSKSGEDYLTVQYEKIVPLLIEGMKEQQAQIEKLTTILEEVTKQLNNGNNI